MKNKIYKVRNWRLVPTQAYVPDTMYMDLYGNYIKTDKANNPKVVVHNTHVFNHEQYRQNSEIEWDGTITFALGKPHLEELIIKLAANLYEDTKLNKSILAESYRQTTKTKSSTSTRRKLGETRR